MIADKNGKVKLATGNAMSASPRSSDAKYLMAIETFRKCNEKLIPSTLEEKFLKKKQQTPSFESLEAGFNEVSARWNKMIEAVAPWQTLLNETATLADSRHPSGGHVLGRPIGITAFVGAFASAPDTLSVDRIRLTVEAFSDLNSAPWPGVLWNSATKKMNVTVVAEKLACRLWRYLLGLDENRQNLETDWKAMIDPRGERHDLRLPNPQT